MTAVPTMNCQRCASDVPAGNFCGLCGDPEGAPAGGVISLRPETFGAAPAEAVLRPYLASSLFPQLPSGSRRPFRLTYGVAAAAMIGAVILRLPAIGISVGALGLPVLFLMYLRASGAARDVPRIALTVAAVLSAALGTAWVLVAGQVVAKTYGVPMAVGLALHHLLREGFAIPMVGMALMVLPPVLIRLFRPRSRESLDGFMIGALSALCFSAAATLTRLAPQVTTGLIAHARPIEGLFVEALLCGVTVPISAAAAGGAAGAALWFRPRGSDQRRVQVVLGLLAAAMLMVHGAVGVIDIVGVPLVTMATVHLVMTVLELLGLRVCLQLALLHETHDPIREDRPLLCPHCDMVVPDMAFCPSCGAANRASSQQSRRLRRGEDPDPVPEQEYPGYALPAPTYLAPQIRRPRFGWLLGQWGAPILTVGLLLGAVALVLTPKIAHYMCPPECGKPPTGMPVMALPRYTSPDGAFTVSYPAPGSAYRIDTAKSGVTATYTGGDGGVMQLFSEPANGRSARDIAMAILKRTYPDAKVSYEVPNAMVGYQPGYGVVADDWPQGSSSSYARVRILLMTGVKNDVALVAFGTGPYHAFGPDFGPGQPSAVNLEIAQDMGKYVNSFHWKGDPER